MIRKFATRAGLKETLGVVFYTNLWLFQFWKILVRAKGVIKIIAYTTKSINEGSIYALLNSYKIVLACYEDVKMSEALKFQFVAEFCRLPWF